MGEALVFSGVEAGELDVAFLLRGVTSGRIGWSAQVQTGTFDYSLYRKTHTDSARLNLNFALTPQLLLTAM